jgi:catechol 2,3-dioxygenase-like lactoylglutathione lyase family enzyme
MLNDSKVEANIPAADLQRARTFYADILGLTPVQDMGVNLVYETAGGTRFNIYETAFAGQAGHTIAQWHVTDIESEVRDLEGKGVAFEVYDMPGEKSPAGAITAGGAKAAWFKDSEGNTMCLDQAES